MKTRQAFTLAEVLITLTIIGIIAAMTIPSLITSIDLDRKQAEAVIKKTFTTFNDATKQIVMLETTSHTMGDVGCADSNCIRDLYGKYVAYPQTCNSDAQSNCLGDAPVASSTNPSTSALGLPVFAAEGDEESGENEGNSGIATPDFTSKSLAVLADGTLVGFRYDNNCNLITRAIIEYDGATSDIEKSCVAITVDTNGAKKPNAIGKDRYQFAIGKLGVKYKAPETSSNTTAPVTPTP